MCQVVVGSYTVGSVTCWQADDILCLTCAIRLVAIIDTTYSVRILLGIDI